MTCEPKNESTVYLTKEQLQRLSGLSCDALVGLQLHTDANNETYVRFDMVWVDDPSQTKHGIVWADGAWRDET
jgi:hypothetical protein